MEVAVEPVESARNCEMSESARCSVEALLELLKAYQSLQLIDFGGILFIQREGISIGS